jgi:hypothetical protein
MKNKALLVVLIAAMFMGSLFALSLRYTPPEKNEAGETVKHGWIHLTSLSAADTGDGVDHIENIYIVPLAEIAANITSSPYETNEDVAWEHGDDVDGFDDGEELAGDTPYSTNYAIVVEVNFSDKAYNSSSADWETGLVLANFSSTDLSLSEVTMSEATDFSQQDGTTSAHLSFYYDWSGSGDTLTVGESVTIDDLDIYYWGVVT